MSALFSPSSPAGVLALTIAGASSIASAQPSTVEEVTVLGSRTSHANNRVDQDAVQRQAGAMNVVNAIDNLPGVKITGADAFNADPWSSGINIRGFSVGLRESKLGQTIDGVPGAYASYYNGGSPATKFIDAENVYTIQVNQGTADLSSPTSAALGGTINYVSADPQEEASSLFTSMIGDYNARRYFFRYDTGRIFDHTRAYLSYSDFHSNRWVYEGSDDSGSDQTHFEMKFITTLDQTEITGRVSIDESHDDPVIEQKRSELEKSWDVDGSSMAWSADPLVSENYAGVWTAHRDNSLAYLRVKHQFSDAVEVTATPYYHDQEGQGDWAPPYQKIALNSQGRRILRGGEAVQGFLENPSNGRLVLKDRDYVDFDGTSIKSSDCYDGEGDNQTAKSHCIPVMTYRTSHYEMQRSGITLDTSLIVGDHEIKAGVWVEQRDRVFYRDWHEILDIRAGWKFDRNPMWFDFRQEFETQTVKYYLSDSWTIGQMTINAGIQQFFVSLKGETLNWDGNGRQTASDNVKFDSDSRVLPSFGLMYELGNGVELFGHYSQNFGAVGDWALEKTGTNFDELEPESANNYELGLRYQGDRFQSTLAVYYNDHQNAITFLSDDYLTGEASGSGINYQAGTGGSYVNAGDGIESRGIELGLNYTLTDHLTLTSAMTYNRSEYQESFDGTSDKSNRVVDVRAGNDVPGAPTEMISLGLHYDRSDFRLGIDAKYNGETAGDATNSKALYIPSYTLVDAYAGVHRELNGDFAKSVDISLTVTNLMDKDYIGGLYDHYKQRYFVGAPRTAALNIAVNF